MPTTLRRVAFARRHLSRLAGFDCGELPWEREVTEWIKGAPYGVFDHLAAGGQVWLYANDARDIVGFGALGETTWRWPTNRDRPRRLNIIPALGVDTRFRGQPPGPPEEHYAAQILRDLIHEATLHEERDLVLGLYVHPQNTRAVHFYERAGFVPFFRTYTDAQSGAVYHSMVLVLPKRNEQH